MLNNQIKRIHEELKTTSGVGIIRKAMSGGDYEYVLITTPKPIADYNSKLREDKIRIDKNEEQMRRIIADRKL